MSGLATNRRPPAILSIRPHGFEAYENDGVRKTSHVMLAGDFTGGNLVLGLLLERRGNQRVVRLAFSHPETGETFPAEPVEEEQWPQPYEALREFLPPDADHRWVVFRIAAMAAEFESELVLRPKPRPGAFQEVRVIAFHAEDGQSTRDILGDLRRGIYAYGISIVRRDGEWPEPNGDASKKL
jgi:hypothetical protein